MNFNSLDVIVYFSSSTQNTHRFVESLGLPSERIPVSPREFLKVSYPYVLVVPTYAGGDGLGAVVKPIKRFLNDEGNRKLLRGVISGGNRNFGEYFGYAADVISSKCNVPILYKFELSGTDEDVEKVSKGIRNFMNESD